MSKHIPTGTAVVLRYIGGDGAINWAMPCRVVKDCEVRTILYQSTGTRYKRSDWDRERPNLPRVMRDAEWTERDVLRFMYPGRMFSVWAWWNSSDGEFAGWYINIEEEFTRTPLGFDTRDLELDIVVKPDFTWYWKDEDDLEIRRVNGSYPLELYDRIKRAGDEAVKVLERRDPPFDEPWNEWSPGELAHPVNLPSNWDR